MAAVGFRLECRKIAIFFFAKGLYYNSSEYSDISAFSLLTLKYDYLVMCLKIAGIRIIKADPDHTVPL